ncbi:sugar phosphate isomerase/epimerase family protein [Flavitalea flava]
MKILFFCPRWGSEQLSWDSFFSRVKEAGYAGVEISLPSSVEEQETIMNGLAKYGLLWIGQHWETVTPDFEQHLREYGARLRLLGSYHPLFINTQTGKDFYSFERNEALILRAEGIAREMGLPIYHETHRGKFSFSSHITHSYLKIIPSLKITLDISHWIAVAETLLYDQQEAVDLAISRTEHIHSRVGFTEGPQINDPRAPEWKEVLEAHLVRWDRVITLQRERNRSSFTITSEFGPSPYMPLQPYTLQPVADQWEVNVYMMNFLRNRYAGK